MRVYVLDTDELRMEHPMMSSAVHGPYSSKEDAERVTAPYHLMEIFRGYDVVIYAIKESV